MLFALYEWVVADKSVGRRLQQRKFTLLLVSLINVQDIPPIQCQLIKLYSKK